MDFELDFLPVGDASKAGDAIALRYNSENGFKVIVIDGGTLEAGEALVDHIKNVYGTAHVEHLISTHPDSDHASGLRHVLENLEVDNIWMHGL